MADEITTIDPGRPLEEMIGVLTVRRADGREMSLQEFPLVETLSGAEDHTR